jgi:hypothetical protein
MKPKVHYSLMRLNGKDRSACGLDLHKADWKVGASVAKADVTCRKCKRTKVFKEENK